MESSFEGRVDPDLLGGVDHYRSLQLPTVMDEIGNARRRYADQLAWRTDARSSSCLKVEEVRVSLSNPDRRVRVRVAGDAKENTPVLIWIPGGGMLFSEFALNRRKCAELADALKCAVVEVEYRLAPETKAPGPLLDCYGVLCWVVREAPRRGWDVMRMSVLGVSAGGCLAVGATLLAKQRDDISVAFQCLVYPMLDPLCSTASMYEFARVPTWSRSNNLLGWKALLEDSDVTQDFEPFVIPVKSTRLDLLPPTYIQVAELDIFRDEDLNFADRLQRAGVDVQVQTYDGGYHSFDQVVPTAELSRRCFRDRLRAITTATSARATPPLSTSSGYHAWGMNGYR